MTDTPPPPAPLTADFTASEPTRKEPAMKVWTLTVEDSRDRIFTTVHYDEAMAMKALRENYGSEYEELSEDDLIQTLIDEHGLVIYIEDHDVPEPQEQA